MQDLNRAQATRGATQATVDGAKHRKRGCYGATAMKRKVTNKPLWARPAAIAENFGIPRGSLYRLLADNPQIRTANLRGKGSARLVNVADLERYLEEQTQAV